MAFASINQASVGGGSSNALAIQSDGIFMPRLSTGQRTALALTTGDTGLTVYDFTLKNLFIWNGTAWESIPSSGDAGVNGAVQYNDNGIVSGASNFIYDKVTSAVSITGDLTVDTSTLKVDSVNDRVGIGTTTPGVRVDILSNSNTSLTAILRVNSNNAAVNTFLAYDGLIASGGMTLQSGPSPFIINTNGANERYRLASDGVATWSNVGGIAGTAMTLNSTGLGIGVVPTNLAGQTRVEIKGSGSGNLTLRTASANASARDWQIACNLDAFGELNFRQGASQGAEPNSGTTRMVLDASGNLLVGVTSTSVPGVGNTTAGSSLNASGAAIFSNAGSQALYLNTNVDGQLASFRRSGLAVGSISVTTIGTLYNTSSDYRLKESVKPLSGGLARVSALKPSSYQWKSNGSAGEGFLAHELAEVVPAAVSGEKDAVNADGTIKSQGIDMSRIVPILVAAIQELAAEVNALKNA